MKKFLTIIIGLAAIVQIVCAQNRFPKPDFESGYNYPEHHYAVPAEGMWAVVDVLMLVALMSVVAWAVVKRGVRTPVIAVSLISVLYFGFFRGGCVCSVGSLQNVALTIADSSYIIPLTAFLFFILPILFTLLFGRVFCGGVCPLGALQELVNVKNYKLSKTVTTVLGLIPWFYLAFAVLFAVTESGFLICRFDPFVGIFRMGGDIVLISIGVILLIISIFIGRPFCRFICPYGALLSLFSRVSFWRTRITRQECINCDLCSSSCPVDAILPPNENKVGEGRMKGVRRILIYVVVLPAMAALGAFAMNSISERLAESNKTVRLSRIIESGDTESEEALAFYGRGGVIEELYGQRDQKVAQFKLYSSVAGGFMGLVVGLTLIGLSVKRTRKTYSIDSASCVSCGRCFSYCPQKKL